jgi:four helix bundle protein
LVFGRWPERDKVGPSSFVAGLALVFELTYRMVAAFGSGQGPTTKDQRLPGGLMSSSFCDLRVWQQAMDLAVEVYKLTDSFPRQEVYGLANQIRRAAVSVASNIAEGKGRRTDADFSAFLFNARGSLLELETQVMLAQRLGFIGREDEKRIIKAAAAIGSGLAGLINSMKPKAAAARAL